MIPFLRYYILLLVCLLPIRIEAEGWTPETLPMVHLQDARRYVCNPDGVLTQAAVDSTDALLYALERDKGIETVVVVVEHLEGDDPYQFSMELGRKYGIGNKEQNTGLIVVLSVGDRSYQILTGRGLEGTLPDAICRRIQNQVMLPLLKDEQWDAAIVETMRTIDGVVRGDSSISKIEDEEESPIAVILGAIAILVFVFVLFVVVLKLSLRKCPKCGQKSLTAVSSSQVRIGNNYYRRVLWKCKKCGYEEHKDEHSNPAQAAGGASTMMFPMRGRGGGFGGGFSGGSFGGGSFGGGGSGGRF